MKENETTSQKVSHDLSNYFVNANEWQCRQWTCWWYAVGIDHYYDFNPNIII